MARELPDIRPRVQRPKAVAMDPQGFTFMPCGHCGPLALILSTRVDDGRRMTTLTSAERIAEISTDEGADLSRLAPGDLCDLGINGWPQDWPPQHIAWGLIDAMATALIGGMSWSAVAERAVAAQHRSTALLN
jgi:hypothetical protein